MKIKAITITILLIALLAVSVTVQAESCGCQAWGLTPGFWLGGKGYDLWPTDPTTGDLVYSHNQPVGSIFDISDSTIAAMTLDQVLGYGGPDMRIKLLRQAIAALLNDASNYGNGGTFGPYQYYPVDDWWIKYNVNGALASGSKPVMEELKNWFEGFNTLGG